MNHSKKTILVVEDERPLQRAIKKKLEMEGFETILAETCDQAFDHVQNSESIFAIWLDHYLLGKKTGLDLVSHLQEREQKRQIPVFVVSNTAGPEKRQAYLNYGVVKFYIKADNRLDGIIQDIRRYLENPEE